MGVTDRLTPEFRAILFYFTFFMGAGAGVTYAAIWMQDMGISEAEIGIINAVPVFLMLGINLIAGRIADRAEDWRSVIVFGALLAGLIPVALFFVHGFWGVLIVWTLSALPAGAIGPVADAATMRMTQRNGTDFGAIRAWGTVGYMGFNALTGLLVVWFGGGIFVPLIVFLALLRAATALQLPKFRAPPHVAIPGQTVPLAKKFREVMKPWFLLPLVGFAMIFATHLVLNAFGALLWKAQGIPESIIGPLIALGAAAEATMMFLFRRLVGRFSARQMLLLSAVVSILRWIAMGFSPPIWVLIPMQLLHSITFALGFLGSVRFIANHTGEDIAAEAQSFSVVLQQGFSVLALTGFGWLVGMIGAHAYFVAGGFALIGGLCVIVSMRLKEPTRVMAMAK
jgi:MFS transporter, PPP family, 3-phenylpropionic acid transporter